MMGTILKFARQSIRDENGMTAADRHEASIRCSVCGKHGGAFEDHNETTVEATATEGRDAVIKRIRAALKRRSGKTWSVTGGHGTAWGWIKIKAPPARCTARYRLKAEGLAQVPENYEEYDSGQPGGFMTPADRAELGALLGMDGPVHIQGESVAASSAYRREYIDRAEGRAPSVTGQQYWD